MDGVCSKTLEEYKSDWGTSFSLKSKGNIQIIEDEENDRGPAFEIDGMKFTPEEFAKLISTYTSFIMQYQIRDGSSPLLSENEYLVPVWQLLLTGEVSCHIKMYQRLTSYFTKS